MRPFRFFVNAVLTQRQHAVPLVAIRAGLVPKNVELPAGGRMMMVQHLVWPAKARIAIAAGALILIGGVAWAVGSPQLLVSQKGREFNPKEITINRGESVQIVNDDGDLWHHAYIDSTRLKFDSGGQKPNDRTAIAFPVPGKFDVLCAIHPKMKLIVNVQ